MTQPTFRDVELISAYLDGQLTQADAARLETRLKTGAELRGVLAEMGQARSLLRKLPARRAPRNFTLTAKMAGIKPPQPRTFTIFRFASVLATVLFLFAYMANLSVPAMTALRAAAPVLGGAGGGGDGNASALELYAPAATSAAALPAAPLAADTAAPTATAELRALAPALVNENPAPTEMAFAAAPQAKLSPGEQEQTQSQPAQEPVRLPVSPFLLFGLLGFAVLSGGSAYLMRLRAERTWFNDRSLPQGKVSPRQLAGILQGIVVVIALVISIYWLSNTTFYASVPAALPAGLGDKGPGSGFEQGGTGAPGAQGFTLMPGLGYNFSAVDAGGLVTTIDFPQDVFKPEMLVTYFPGLSVITAEIAYPVFTSFSLVPAENGAQPQVPFTISMDYGNVVASSVDENKLALYWWSGSDWQDAAATCNPAAVYEHLLDVHQVRITVCQMGSFALVAP